MSNEIALDESRSSSRDSGITTNQGHFEEVGARLGEEMEYLSRSDSGDCPFEHLLGRGATWQDRHPGLVDRTPQRESLSVSAPRTNVFRTGADGDVTNVRFYLFVNQIPTTCRTRCPVASPTRYPTLGPMGWCSPR